MEGFIKIVLQALFIYLFSLRSVNTNFKLRNTILLKKTRKCDFNI